MIDIDHFKAFNDRYGHLAGDRALRGVAGILRGAARRASDLVFRYGGEEFCVLAAGMNASDAFDMARAMRDGVRELAIENVAGEGRQLTVSVGLTFVTEPGPHNLAVLLQAADEALYAAKQAGRNRVEVAARPRLAAARA
jgi:diguanylate cyclase (GGDEF)-like protein